MKKHLYEIKNSKLPSYIKWWLIKYKNAGNLSEILTNLVSPVTLLNSLRRKFKIFEIYGNSIQQEGTPTYQNQIQIQNITGNINVKVQNKNFLKYPYDISSYNANGLSVKFNNNGTILLNGTTTGICYLNLVGINLKRHLPEGEYILNGFKLGISGYIRITIFSSDDSSITRDDTGNGVQFSIGENQTFSMYIRINSGQTLENVIIEPMLRLSNVVNESYTLSEEQNAIFPLENGQIIHEDDYIADKIYQNRRTIILNGGENVGRNNQSDNWLSFSISSFQDIIDKTNTLNIMCNSLKPSSSNTANTIRIASSGNIIVFVPTDFCEYTPASFKAKLAELYEARTPIIIEIPLEETQEIEFTESQREAKAQIDKLYTYDDITYITSDNNPLPFFKIQYIEKENEL